MNPNTFLRMASLATLALALSPAARAVAVVVPASPATFTFNTGTFFTTTTAGYKFSGQQDLTGTKDYYIYFSFTGSHGATLFGNNLKFTNGSGQWIADPNLSTTNGTKGLDANGATLLLSDNNGFFKVPIYQFGDQFSFDLTENGNQTGLPSMLTMTAKDDVATLANITFTPSGGPNTTVTYTSLPGVTVAPTPEPSPAAVLALGMLSLGRLIAVRRRARL